MQLDGVTIRSSLLIQPNMHTPLTQ